MGVTPVGKAESVDDRGVAHRCSRGRNKSARTTVRRPGSLRGAATVMVGFAVASGASAPSPVFAPRSDRVRPLTPDGGPGISSLREQGRALLRSGAEQSRTEPVLFALGCPFVPLCQLHRPSSTADDRVDKVVDEAVDDQGHGSPMDATTVGTVGSVRRSLPGSAGARWGSVRSGTSSSASASMACRS
jgi:hypothetical protein